MHVTNYVIRTDISNINTENTKRIYCIKIHDRVQPHLIKIATKVLSTHQKRTMYVQQETEKFTFKRTDETTEYNWKVWKIRKTLPFLYDNDQFQNALFPYPSAAPKNEV